MPRITSIKCPHCGAKAQAILPPEGLIVLGPCPACKEFVLLIANIPLPADKEIIIHGSPEERYEHLLSVLNAFLEQRVATLVEQIEQDPYRMIEEEDIAENRDRQDERSRPTFVNKISDDEMRRFVEEELPRIDDSTYFRTIFH